MMENSNKDKVIQYLCNLISEYWEDKEVVPREPKKIMLGYWIFILHNNGILQASILEDIALMFGIRFHTMNFAYILFGDVYHSEQFKLMCDELRGK